MIRRTLLALVCLGIASHLPAQAPTVLDVFQEFDRLAAQPLWPEFQPRTVAVEVYDGTRTYLVHHPKPPEGFVTGLPEPKLTEAEGQVAVEAEGVKGSFHGRTERNGQRIRLVLP